MTAPARDRPVRDALERLFDALTGPARSERTMALLLAGYCAVWSLYGAIAKGSQDIHFDMGEMVAWSRDVTLGTPKHPPLGAWLVRIWFSVMPAQDWAYYLLAMLLATVALWISWRLSARYMPNDKRVVGIALLTLVPLYNLLALKFNPNSLLIPLWAAATWWFLRSYETRRAGWAVLAGIGAAAAMLGKYWSVILLAGLGIAALSDPRRGAYFRSPAPWLTIAVGSALLAPHVVWIVNHDFIPFTYAFETHESTLWNAALFSLRFLVGSLLYVAVPLVLFAIVVPPHRDTLRDMLWPKLPERRMVMIAFVAPFVIAAVIAVLLMIEIDTTWAMSMMTLLPVVLLSSPLVSVKRAAAVGVLGLAIVVPFLMVAASPIIAAVIHVRGVPNYATHYRLIARALEHAWTARTDAPLRIVGSDTNIGNGVVFYLPSRPSTYDIVGPVETPWVDDARIRREGIAMVCAEPVTSCVQAMNAFAARSPGAERSDVTISHRYLGMADDPVHYLIVTVPPQASASP